MTEKASEHRQRKPRMKRVPRVDTGKKIVVRVTPNELAYLRREAGEVGISSYVRSTLFGGGVRSRDVLRAIATLHVAGLNVKGLADAETATGPATTALNEVRTAIARLARLLPGGGDEVAP